MRRFSFESSHSTVRRAYAGAGVRGTGGVRTMYLERSEKASSTSFLSVSTLAEATG